MLKYVLQEVPPSRDVRKPDGGITDVLAYPAPIPALVDRVWS